MKFSAFSTVVRRSLSMVFVVASPQMLPAETLTVAVENKDWMPYYLWQDGTPSGPCPEIAAGAIRLMGAEVDFVGFPWARVLLAVEQNSVDAGLCGTKTPERAVFSHFPDEPLLSYDATLFVHADSPLQGSDLTAMKGMTFGSISGYNFGGVDQSLEEMGLTRRNANDRDALLNHLLNGRLDVVLDSSLPTLADAKRLGIDGQIRPLLPSLSETPAYLFFGKQEGVEDLAARFSEALRQFKTTEDYRVILERYGL